MSQTCPQCQQSNDATARYCRSCGFLLSATVAEGKTVAMGAPPQSGAPILDINTISDMMKKRFPSDQGLTTVCAEPGNDQREDSALIIDVSYSMSEMYDDRTNKLTAAGQAGINYILRKFNSDPKDEIAAATFNSRSKVLMKMVPVGENKTALIKKLQRLGAGNGTDLNAGLLAAKQLFEWRKDDVVRRVLLLTDGQGGDPLATVTELKDRGVVIDVVGVGPDPSEVNEELLRQVASVIRGETRYRFIRDGQTLATHYTYLAGKTMTGR